MLPTATLFFLERGEVRGGEGRRVVVVVVLLLHRPFTGSGRPTVREGKELQPAPPFGRGQDAGKPHPPFRVVGGEGKEKLLCGGLCFRLAIPRHRLLASSLMALLPRMAGGWELNLRVVPYASSRPTGDGREGKKRLMRRGRSNRRHESPPYFRRRTTRGPFIRPRRRHIKPRDAMIRVVHGPTCHHHTPVVTRRTRCRYASREGKYLNGSGGYGKAWHVGDGHRRIDGHRRGKAFPTTARMTFAFLFLPRRRRRRRRKPAILFGVLSAPRLCEGVIDQAIAIDQLCGGRPAPLPIRCHRCHFLWYFFCASARGGGPRMTLFFLVVVVDVFFFLHLTPFFSCFLLFLWCMLAARGGTGERIGGNVMGVDMQHKHIHRPSPPGHGHIQSHRCGRRRRRRRHQRWRTILLHLVFLVLRARRVWREDERGGGIGGGRVLLYHRSGCARVLPTMAGACRAWSLSLLPW